MYVANKPLFFCKQTLIPVSVVTETAKQQLDQGQYTH